MRWLFAELQNTTPFDFYARLLSKSITLADLQTFEHLLNTFITLYTTPAIGYPNIHFHTFCLLHPFHQRRRLGKKRPIHLWVRFVSEEKFERSNCLELSNWSPLWQQYSYCRPHFGGITRIYTNKPKKDILISWNSFDQALSFSAIHHSRFLWPFSITLSSICQIIRSERSLIVIQALCLRLQSSNQIAFKTIQYQGRFWLAQIISRLGVIIPFSKIEQGRALGEDVQRPASAGYERDLHPTLVKQIHRHLPVTLYSTL